MTAELLPP